MTDEKNELEEVEAGPSILFGVVLYMTTDGQMGQQDMHSAGNALVVADPPSISALLGAARDANLADSTAQVTLGYMAKLQKNLKEAAKTEAKKATIVGLDGKVIN